MIKYRFLLPTSSSLLPPHFPLHLQAISQLTGTRTHLGFEVIFCSSFCAKLVLILTTKFAYVLMVWETPHLFSTAQLVSMWTKVAQGVTWGKACMLLQVIMSLGVGPLCAHMDRVRRAGRSRRGCRHRQTHRTLSQNGRESLEGRLVPASTVTTPLAFAWFTVLTEPLHSSCTANQSTEDLPES